MIIQNKGSNVQNIDDVLRVPDIKLCSVGHSVTLSNARIERMRTRSVWTEFLEWILSIGLTE